jgi:hypothetical protein
MLSNWGAIQPGYHPGEWPGSFEWRHAESAVSPGQKPQSLDSHHPLDGSGERLIILAQPLTGQCQGIIAETGIHDVGVDQLEKQFHFTGDRLRE